LQTKVGSPNQITITGDSTAPENSPLLSFSRSHYRPWPHIPKKTKIQNKSYKTKIYNAAFSQVFFFAAVFSHDPSQNNNIGDNFSDF